jgi:two-component system sensor histidine kinase UhpB
VCTAIFPKPLDWGTPAVHYLPVPFLLWAAVRFGPGMTGASLLAVAFTSSWHALRGNGMFAGEDPERNVVSLQVFLLSISLPLLCLAMVMKEREETMRELVANRNAIRISVDTVRDLAGRLIAAQEEERARIGRELHDNVSQHVAEMALTLSATRREPAVRAANVDSTFQRLYDQTADLFESVRALSHQLHPSLLRHAGLVPAMQALCSTFRRQYDIALEFHPQIVEPITPDVSLCIYRVTQEALRNVAAHAGARSVRVTLVRTDGELLLHVIDDGRGFEIESARGRGLGLVSMEERVRLVHGTLRIHATHAGCDVSVRIPAEPAV